jgi:hypothetical protein
LESGNWQFRRERPRPQFQCKGLSSLDREFIAEHADMRRSLDADAHPVATDTHHGHHYGIADPNPFVLFAGEHKHEQPPFWKKSEDELL